MTTAYINRIATAVPPHDVHDDFMRLAATMLPPDRRTQTVFARMAERSGIDHRYSYLAASRDPAGAQLDEQAFYVRGRFPGTAARMRRYEDLAPLLAAQAVGRLELDTETGPVTHLIIASCTGFAAPGLDLALTERCGLPSTVERSIIGFMGCYAAITALKLARHIVRSEPAARVLVVNLELCTLHFQETDDLAELLMYLLWGDGCAAALVSGEPQGLALDSFQALVLPGTADLMQWHIGDAGFTMELSGKVPFAIEKALHLHGGEILGGLGPDAIDLWAVHPGGRSILDAVEAALGLEHNGLTASRAVLKSYGNMSSATVMFVLEALMREAQPGARGCAMSFGPGLTAETMLFHAATATRSGAREDRTATREARVHELAT